MEKHLISSKRRRVFSIKPNKLSVRAAFTRKYVNHLLPALMKIKMMKKPISDENDDVSELKKSVRHEVDMALVMSTDGYYAWSHALQKKLQKIVDVNVGCSIHRLMPWPCVHENAEVFPMKFCANPREESSGRRKEEGGKESEEEEISRRLGSLRNIVPGGDEMGESEVLAEVGSYIMYLELQVNVLRCLAEL